jgi:hypothetical protein
MNNPTLHKQMNAIMERFDFGRVLKTMEALNWTWTACAVMTEDELRKTAMHLMDCSIRSYEESDKWTYTSTGGFTARVDVYSTGPHLMLQFCVEQAD